MGIHTYVTDNDTDAYAKRFAKTPCNIDATDVTKLEKLIKEECIDGVIVGVAESLIPAYEKICTDLNFPCYGNKELFSLFIDKGNFKNICRRYALPVVEEFYVSSDYTDEELKAITLPVVVKPIDSCSSKGISVCMTFNELKAGIVKALSFSRSKRFLIEKYMTGQEVIVYYAFQNGEPVFVAMCDRYTNKEQKGVAPLPISYIFPSSHLCKYIAEVDDKVKNMFRRIGMKNGFIFIQSFIDEEGGVKFYEPGYRLNGAQEHYIVSTATGIDAKEYLINFALTGKGSEDRISEKADPFLNGMYGCKLSPLIREGKIRRIIGLEKIEKLSDVVSINPSYDVEDVVNGYGTLKQIICRFFIVSKSLLDMKVTIDKIQKLFDVLDEHGDSMLLELFDTDIILSNYE